MRNRGSSSSWRRRKRWLFALAAVALGLVAVEGGLRLAGYRPLPTRPLSNNPELLFQYSKFRPSASLIWELRPGWSGREGPGTVIVNSRGLREREIPVEKPPGVFRILCLGDSVTFGHWVEAEEAYPRQLEMLLEARTAGRIEVINAGVPGYSSFQEAEWLAAEGWRYDPDLLVVGFVLNDVVERYRTLAAYGGESTVLGVDTTVTLSPLQRLLRRTAFHRFVFSMMQRREKQRQVYSVRRMFDESLSGDMEKAWKLVEEELGGLHDAARKRSVPVLLAAFPYRFQVAESLEPRPQQRLAGWARERDLPFLDLMDVFSELGPEAAFLDADHPTVAGHLAVARRLAVELERRRLLAAPPAV